MDDKNEKTGFSKAADLAAEEIVENEIIRVLSNLARGVVFVIMVIGLYLSLTGGNIFYSVAFAAFLLSAMLDVFFPNTQSRAVIVTGMICSTIVLIAAITVVLKQ